MVVCFAAVICIAINAGEDNLEIADTTIGDIEVSTEYEYQAN